MIGLRQDLIKDLEKSLFGNHLENIEPKDNKKRSFAPPSLPKEDYFAETNEYLKYQEEQEEDRVRYSDDYDSSGSGLNKKRNRSITSRVKDEGLKILTNKQMLNRLPILLAQIQAGSNSNKLKNETRQILHSLYRSKVLTKTVYSNLFRSIHA